MVPALFPTIEPHKTGFLPVDSIHTIYYEESGNPRGVPVVFLHGGPGVGMYPAYRRFFDPAAWRIIGFDQRGCGKSTPFADVTANSPAHLVSDIDHLRQHLGIERWHVFGGSWGSTLALTYAIAHPERILSLILRAIFLMRQREIDWFMSGMRMLRPEAWQNFTGLIAPEHHHRLLDEYLEHLLDPSPSVHMEAARRWFKYETSSASFAQDAMTSGLPPDDDALALSMARLEAYYFKHHKFSPDDWLLREVERYRHIPGVIVQGQYDLVCPPVSAFDLHKAWPEAEYILVKDAGHSIMEPGITHALLDATERLKHIR
ncbi:MAG: prolyl aminopeptidase [Bdellovibrionales bacterium]